MKGSRATDLRDLDQDENGDEGLFNADSDDSGTQAL